MDRLKKTKRWFHLTWINLVSHVCIWQRFDLTRAGETRWLLRGQMHFKCKRGAHTRQLFRWRSRQFLVTNLVRLMWWHSTNTIVDDCHLTNQIEHCCQGLMMWSITNCSSSFDAAADNLSQLDKENSFIHLYQ